MRLFCSLWDRTREPLASTQKVPRHDEGQETTVEDGTPVEGVNVWFGDFRECEDWKSEDCNSDMSVLFFQKKGARIARVGFDIPVHTKAIHLTGLDHLPNENGPGL